MATFSYPLQSNRLKSQYFTKLNGAEQLANNAFFEQSQSSIDANINTTGLEIISSSGNEIASSAANISTNGILFTTSSGNVSLISNTNIVTSGLEITSSQGNESTSANGNINVIGSTQTLNGGNITVDTSSSINTNAIGSLISTSFGNETS